MPRWLSDRIAGRPEPVHRVDRGRARSVATTSGRPTASSKDEPVRRAEESRRAGQLDGQRLLPDADSGQLLAVRVGAPGRRRAMPGQDRGHLHHSPQCRRPAGGRRGTSAASRTEPARTAKARNSVPSLVTTDEGDVSVFLEHGQRQSRHLPEPPPARRQLRPPEAGSRTQYRVRRPDAQCPRRRPGNRVQLDAHDRRATARPAFGSFDVYVSQRSSTRKQWSAPVNLGPNVNTAGSETRATMSWDGRRLYSAATATSTRAAGPGCAAAIDPPEDCRPGSGLTSLERDASPLRASSAPRRSRGRPVTPRRRIPS